MSITQAWLALVTVALLANLALTVGVLRALRRSPGVSGAARVARPHPGTTVSVPVEWNLEPELEHALHGVALLALVVPGCMGCQVLRSEFDSFRLPVDVPLVVIADAVVAGLDSREYLQSSWEIATTSGVAAAALSTVGGLGSPDELPVVALVRDGIVVASAHRLSHLMQMLRPSDWASADQRIVAGS